MNKGNGTIGNPRVPYVREIILCAKVDRGRPDVYRIM